jgi:hypothetical protein
MKSRTGLSWVCRIAGMFALFTSPPSAGATILFQSIPDLAADPESNGWCSSCYGYYVVFDTFTLSSPSMVGSIQFDVQQLVGYPNPPSFFPTDVTVNIWTTFHPNGGGWPVETLWPGLKYFRRHFHPRTFWRS